MNPTATAQPARPRTMVDVARPALPASIPHAVVTPPVAPAQAPASDTTMTANIVNNIPMHAPTQAAAPAVTEDDELDTIMRDVGHQLKQADRQTAKKHHPLFGRKHHAPAPKPAPLGAPAVAAPATVTAVLSAPTRTQAPAAAAATPTAVKPVKPASAPIGAIFMTIVVTGALIAAAIYSYK